MNRDDTWSGRVRIPGADLHVTVVRRTIPESYTTEPTAEDREYAAAYDFRRLLKSMQKKGK